MGEFSKWLLHEDRKELFEYLFANALGIVFLLLAALALWPLGRASMSVSLAKGYCVFWAAMYAVTVLLVLWRRIFRVEMDTHYDAYVLSALFVSASLQAGWSAFAVLTVHRFAAGVSHWAVVALYFVGLLSCYVAFVIVSSFYMGSIYRMFNLVLALISFVLFSAWPAAARFLYGWFFDRFQNG